MYIHPAISHRVFYSILYARYIYIIGRTFSVKVHVPCPLFVCVAVVVPGDGGHRLRKTETIYSITGDHS